MGKGIQLRWNDAEDRALRMVVRDYRDEIHKTKNAAVNALVAMTGMARNTCYTRFQHALGKEMPCRSSEKSNEST